MAKPRPSPPTTAVPQSGPMTSRPRSRAACLSATSCSTGTWSLKTITSQPASRASIASTNALGPGHRDQHASPGARRARSRWCGARPSVHRRRRTSAPAGASDRSTAASAAARSPSSASRSATTMSLGEAAAGTSKPSPVITSRLSGVAIATWAVDDARHGLDVAADLQQRHRVGVRRAQLDVVLRGGAHAASRSWSRASGPPSVEPGAGGGADGVEGAGRRRARRRCRARAPRRRTGGAPRRAGRSRAASRRAGWSGRGRRATTASTSGVATRAARCIASQPASTSSPSGVSPSPRPSRRAARSRRRGRRRGAGTTNPATVAGGVASTVTGSVLWVAPSPRGGTYAPTSRPIDSGRRRRGASHHQGTPRRRPCATNAGSSGCR